MVDQPLNTWICDLCGQGVEDIDKGYVVWRTKRDPIRYHDFRVVHQGRCDPGQPYDSSLPLKDFVGPEGLTMVLAWLTVGPLKNEEPSNRVEDFAEFVDLVRRVQIPYYEEARQRFDDEGVQADLFDANEFYPYQPEILRRIADGTLG